MKGISRSMPRLLSMIFFSDGTWTVVDEDGRFDTNRLDEIPYLRWFISDTPLAFIP